MNLLTSIPSPGADIRSWTFEIAGLSFTVHAYAICILIGIILAVVITNRRLTARGGEPWIVVDILLWTLPLGIVGARIYHVLTHPADYFGPDKDLMEILYVWNGGIAIFGALIGGGIGAAIACKLAGIRFLSFVDALAPGLLVAQGMGRFGNWFNQELFGQPTDLPWGLEIDRPNAAIPVGIPGDVLFHPTFLYEMLWNVAGAALLVFYFERRFTMRWGRAFGFYLVWYGVGRSIFESIRIDPSEIYFGIRLNVWTALLAIVVGVALIIWSRRRHTGNEKSVSTDGLTYAEREAALESQDAVAESAEAARAVGSTSASSDSSATS